jgi:septum formation topological specificity factor MinE
MEILQSTERDFLVKNCALASVATGASASSLLELRDKIVIVDEASIYHHFWGGRMNPRFVELQRHNDFASWVYHRLHDHVLAERLSVIDPTEFDTLEALRQELLETIERRLDEYETIFWTKKVDRFNFVSSKVIVFDSSLSLHNPEDFPALIAVLPPSSIFYHFIDARTRTRTKTDDFSVWLQFFGSTYDSLIDQIQAIDPYFLSLTQLREELVRVCSCYFERGK